MPLQNSPPPIKLLDRARDAIRLKHYSYRTEHFIMNWIERFLTFLGKPHPKDMGAEEFQAFLTHLAVERHAAASTQNQALSALLFFTSRPQYGFPHFI